MTSRTYIPEIDTLRAIAVLLVVVYHAYPQLAPGGFIGVDVFFVISGFVISRTYLFPLIRREKTLRDFYVARFRRLAPAAIVVLTFSTLAAAILLVPHQLISYAYALLAQPLYLQNFVFWYEGEYFESALTKPLLHTWSLAVEEQFYLFWAFAILFLRRFPSLVLLSVILVGIVSVLAGLVLDVRSPKTVFFMLPMRAWEFSIGIAAFLLSRRLGYLEFKFVNAMVLLAISAIVLSGVWFDASSRFPGHQAAIACCATAVALVAFDSENRNIAWIFSWRPLRYLGEISYGFYLWHWPPLAFFFVWLQRPADAFEATLLMLFALLGASISYHLLENPIRRGRVLQSARSVFKMALSGSLATAILAGLLIESGGLLVRYPPNVQALFQAPMEKGIFRCGKLFTLQNPSAEMCPLFEGTSHVGGVLIIGDSHADVLKETFADIARDLDRSVYLAARNCDFGTYGSNTFCSHDVLDKLMAEAKEEGITEVFAISYWSVDRLSVDGLKTDLARLQNADLDVSIMETVPSDQSYDPLKRAQEAMESGTVNFEGIQVAEHEDDVRQLRKLFTMAFSDSDVDVLRPQDFLCDEFACEYWKHGRPLYFDAHHLTFTGATQLRPLIVSALSES